MPASKNMKYIFRIIFANINSKNDNIVLHLMSTVRLNFNVDNAFTNRNGLIVARVRLL